METLPQLLWLLGDDAQSLDSTMGKTCESLIVHDTRGRATHWTDHVPWKESVRDRESTVESIGVSCLTRLDDTSSVSSTVKCYTDVRRSASITVSDNSSSMSSGSNTLTSCPSSSSLSVSSFVMSKTLKPMSRIIWDAGHGDPPNH